MLVIDPSLPQQADSPEPESSVNLQNHRWFFEQCAANRELLQSIEVVIPVRPADGINCTLARMLSLWWSEGTVWNMLNDHMGGFIEMTRGNIAWDFVNRQRVRKPKYLLMIDNDMEPPINLPYLLARHDQPVVGVLAMHVHDTEGPRGCFTVKCTDGNYRFPTIQRHTLPEKGLLECGHVGTGAILIRRDVLEAFTFSDNDIPFYVPEKIRLMGARVGRLALGEDLAFTEAARTKGFKCYVDLEARCGHRKTLVMSWPKDKTDPALDAKEWLMPAGGQIIGTN